MANAEIVDELPVTSTSVLTDPLVALHDMKFQLSQIRTINDAATIIDAAEALRYALKKADKSLDVVNESVVIKVQAERRAGELLREMEKAPGAKGTGKKVQSHDVTTLADLGIQRMQSSRWQQIASIPEDVFHSKIDDTLSRRTELTSSMMLKLAKSINKSKTKDTFPPISNGKFRCIYADPPWKYGNQGTRAATKNHYETMTVDAICKLTVDGRKVKELADDNAHLHLWTTNAFLFEAQKVIEAWGFTYKSCLVWVKPKLGIGNYWRVSHEFLLFAIRGKLEFQDRSQMSWIKAKRESHSTKPQVFRSVIEKVSPGPRIELFARGQCLGWECWGNQI